MNTKKETIMKLKERAFYIINVNVQDFEKYQLYIKEALPLIKKFNGNVIVAENELENMEGQVFGNLQVIIEFPTKRDALDWYNDPDYQTVKKLRIESSETLGFNLAKEFNLP